ncbi:MAG: SNF2 family helicase [Turicibacter sp.]|nr:SNF2 family helicase [Turicibacter sp.]
MINLEWIAGLAANPAVFSRAQAFFRTNPVRSCLASIEETGYLKIQGEVAEGAKLYHPLIIIDQKKMTSDHRCDCGGFHNKFGACKHVIVTLLKAHEEGRKNRLVIEEENAPADKTLLQLVKTYEEKLGLYPKTPEEGLVRVISKPVSDETALRLELYIGKGRLYLVRDLYEFSDNIMARRTVSYGKELEFKHSLEAFEEDARPLIQMIADAVALARSYATDDSKEPGLLLPPHLVDAYFDMYEAVPAEGLSLHLENPSLQFHLQKSEGGSILSANKKNFKLFFGKNMYFWDEEGGVFRCDEVFTQAYKPLLEALLPGNLEIAEGQLGDILSVLLLVVEKRLVADEEFGDLSVSGMQAKMFVDAHSKSALALSLEFDYGEPGGKLIIRDLPSEIAVKQAIMEQGFLEEAGNQYLLSGDDALYQFAQDGAMKLQEQGEVFISEKAQKMRIKDAGNFSIGVSMRNNWIHLDFEKLGFDPDEFEGILAGYREQKRYVRLKDGTFLNLTSDALLKMTSLLVDLKVEEGDLLGHGLKVPGFRALYLEQFAKKNPSLGLKIDQSLQGVVQTFHELDDSQFIPPKSLGNILRPYQETGYKWLQTLHHFGFSGILADDMGLGKTLQVITMLVANELNEPALIVTPSSLMFNWKMEMEKFAPNLSVLIVSGDPEKRKGLIEEGRSFDVVITSYDLIRRDREHYAKETYGYCIIDEAHYIKNHQTINAKAVKTINSGFRLALTGTPIENSLTDLWSIFDFILPGYLGSYQHFRRVYELPIVKNQEQPTLDRLYQLVSPFIMRRLKKDVLKELPPKIDTALYAQMEAQQEKLYQATLYQMQKSLHNTARSGERFNRMQVLTQLMRLRQLCCHPSLYLQNYEGPSAKHDMCLELIRDCFENKRKILLFSQFTSMLSILAKDLEAMGVDYYLLTGKTKSEKRVQLTEAFNNDDTPIFLISLKAGGTGLNLTGADVVIHYDPWWNLSAENQATDRAHRIGQEKTVQVFKLLTKNTIEEKIQELQERKRELTESVIREGENFINQLDDAEILSLFEGN